MKRRMSSKNVDRIARGRIGEHGLLVTLSADQKEQFLGNDSVQEMLAMIRKRTRTSKNGIVPVPAVSFS
jgi:hypothetical protein